MRSLTEEIVESMQWDALVLDGLLAGPDISDAGHAQIAAVREHLGRYQALLEGPVDRLTDESR